VHAFSITPNPEALILTWPKGIGNIFYAGIKTSRSRLTGGSAVYIWVQSVRIPGFLEERRPATVAKKSADFSIILASSAEKSGRIEVEILFRTLLGKVPLTSAASVIDP
jgi:hypothetical protein